MPPLRLRSVIRAPHISDGFKEDAGVKPPERKHKKNLQIAASKPSFASKMHEHGWKIDGIRTTAVFREAFSGGPRPRSMKIRS